MRVILIYIFLIFSTLLLAAPADTVSAEMADTLIQQPSQQRRGFFPLLLKGVKNIIKEFNTYDTLYIEPQHYKFQAMLQLTNTYEQYRLKSPDGQQIFLSPDVRTTFGPYAGYSLIFLGYTLQLNNLYIGNAKKTFNLSLYTSLIGVDMHYHNDNNYKIHTVSDNDVETSIKRPTTALNVKRWGFNTYYIFNHRKHSYPAAYNQSTCQKRSAGSPLAGIGYSNYDITVSWNEMYDVISQHSSPAQPYTTDVPQRLQYQAYSVYGGYAYNWVFAKNFLLGVSATMTLSYNKTHGEHFRVQHLFKDFNLRNVSVDGLGRLGIVWNNRRFFAGASAQIHSYTYSKQQFSINNTFGNLNVYAGFNFGKKKEYRKTDKLFEF